MKRMMAVLALELVASASAPSQEIRLEGAPGVADALRETLIDGFTARYADIDVSWGAIGSSSSVSALYRGDADVVVLSRRVLPVELELARRLGLNLHETVLALDGIAIVVHPNNRVPSLSLEQLEALYAGHIVRWLGVGGIDRAVRPLSVVEGSGVAAEFRDLVFPSMTSAFGASVEYLPTSADVLDRVANDDGALGFVSMTCDRSRVRTVPIAGASGDVLPSAPTVSDATYPLRSPLRLYTVADPDSELGHFLRFLFLHDGPALVADAGLVPVPAFTSLARTQASPRARPDVAFTRVTFGFRGRRLNAEARQNLMELASRLAWTDEDVWITGHEEPTEARDGLAAARAQTVLEFLEQLNVDPSRMVAEGRGTSEPLASNADLDGRRLNRRADVWILPH